MIEAINLETGEPYSVKETEVLDMPVLLLTSPSPSELDLLSKKLEIDIDDLMDSLDEDERPRLHLEDDYIQLIFRLPLECSNVFTEPTTVPISIYITKTQTIIIRNQIDSYLQSNMKRHAIKTPPTQLGIILQFLNQVITSFEFSVDEVDKKLTQIGEKLIKETSNRELVLLFQLSKAVTYADSALSGNIRAIRKFRSNPFIDLPEDIIDLIEDLEIDFVQQHEMIRIYSQLVDSSLDAYASVISNNQNDLIKILAYISLALTWPTFIASLFGMNVDLPFANDSISFWFILLIAMLPILPAVFLINRRESTN